MAKYQDDAKARIKAGVSGIRSNCKTGRRMNYGEADTRTIVLRTLENLLGWDAIKDITQEQMVGNKGFCDFLVKLNGKPYMVIEVKKVTLGLNETHTQQAQNYAQQDGIDWIVTTNGDHWIVEKLYYVTRRGANPVPKRFKVFETSFLDTQNIRPNDRVDDLYLLSKEAAKHDELKIYCDSLNALQPQELAKRLLQNDVMDRLRIGLKNDIRLSISNAELGERVLQLLRDEAVPQNSNYWLNKLKK